MIGWPHESFCPVAGTPIPGTLGALRGRVTSLAITGQGHGVLDVPPKLLARARVLATGRGLKTDAIDAHSVARRHADDLAAVGRR